MNSETWKIFSPTLEHLSRIGTNTETRKTFQKVKEAFYPQKSNKLTLKRERFSEESKKSLIFQNRHPELLNYWRIHPIIHTPLPSSYKENDPLEGNFFRPLPESNKEEYEIKSIIPEGKDLPISTKEKGCIPNI
jgi:hypothetical protein